MPYRLIDDGRYAGMNREVSPWTLPLGQVYDAQNILFDRPGIARHRGPSTALSALGAVAAFCTSLGFVHSQNAGGTVEELYGVDGRSGTINVINKNTGALTSIGTVAVASAFLVARPVRHFGFTLFTGTDATGALRNMACVAGQTSSTTFTNAVVAQIAAGSPQITLTGADVTTNVKVGAIVEAHNTTQDYIGRVVSIDTTKKFTVWPTPTWTDAAIAIGNLTCVAFMQQAGGACGASFQNRLLLGNTLDAGASTSVISDRRVYYSPLPTETTANPALATQFFSGATFLQSPPNWPRLNYFDVPGADPLIAIEPVNDGELLILTGGAPWVLRGQLATQTTTFAPGVTFDLSPINLPANCLSDLSVQRTPRGVIWAGSEGIWSYGGGGRQPYSPGWRLPIDITEGAMHTYWRNLTRGTSFAVHGSFQTRNHYVISGISAGTTFSLAYNFANGAWATLSGPGTDIFFGVARPTDPSQCFAARWWDQLNVAPTMTNGQVLRVDSIFQPYVAGTTKTDSDGSTIALSLTTRAMSDDTLTQRILRRASIHYQMAATSAAVAVSAGARVDPSDSTGTPTVSLGSLSSTKVLTITAATVATPIVCTTAAHGLQTGDAVDIRGANGNTAANGHWRIKVLSTTTFSLDGSTGNGAYGAPQATVKKITEQEFEASGVDIGQANYLTFSGSPDDFELHGVRLGVMEMPLGMGH